MANETEYANSLHIDYQVALDHASENLVPNSVLLNLIARTKMPSDTQSKRSRKKGSLTRQTLAENAAATIREYTETSTLLQAIKNVVTVKETVESMDFDSGANISSELGEQASKALSLGMDEDICALFPLASNGITAVAALTLLDVSAAALLVKQNTRGKAIRRDAGVAFVGSFQQVHNALLADPLTNGINVHANAGVSVGQAVDAVHSRKGDNGFVTKVAGIDFYEVDVITDDATNEFGAVLAINMALIGMYWDDVKAMDENDVINYGVLSGFRHYSDFGIHWNEGIAKVPSALV